MRKVDRFALRRAMWASFSRVIGVILATGAGSIIRDVVGTRLENIGLATALAFAAWIIMLYAEYERERR